MIAMENCTTSSKSISCPICDEKFDDKLTSFAHLLTEHPMQYVNLKKAVDRRKKVFDGFFDKKVKELEMTRNGNGGDHLKTIKASLLKALKVKSKDVNGTATVIVQARQKNPAMTSVVTPLTKEVVAAIPAPPPPPKMPFRCLNCTKRYPTAYEAVMHDLNSHFQISRFFCGKCNNGVAFAGVRFLINHFLTVHPYDPFICSRCNWCFGRDVAQYEQHLKTEYSVHLMSVYTELHH